MIHAWHKLLICLLGLGLSACADPQPSSLPQALPESASPSVVDGTEAESGGALDAVFGVSVDYEDFSLFCTGTLITSNIVLTGGHCLSGLPPIKKIEVYSRKGLFFGRHRIEATDWRVHPQFNPAADATHDIALVQIPGEFSEGTAPFQLNWEAEFRKNHEVDLYGYGLISRESRRLDGQLRYARMKVTEISEFIVAEPNSTGATLCSGDSGGPVFSVDSSEAKIIGINSRFESPSSLCTKNSGFIVTSIPQNRDWLQQTIDELKTPDSAY